MNATVVLCAVVKDEEPYLDEWIQYHLQLGIQHIYLYDNHSTPTLHFHMPQVTVFHVPEPYIQLLAYYHCHTKAIQVSNPMPDWIGFIDIDEFLVLKNTSVPLGVQFHQWGTLYPHTGAIVFHWAIFGSNGHTHVQNNHYAVRTRFTRRAKDLNPHVKSFIRPEAIRWMLSPHHAELHPPWVARNVLGKPVPDACDSSDDRNATLSVACLHHYFTKSAEEFHRKCQRGRADIPVKRTFAEFAEHDLNDVEDLSALQA